MRSPNCGIDLAPSIVQVPAVTLPDPWRAGVVESPPLLAQLLRTIDERGRQAGDDLLAHFRFTVWPTVYAQVQ